MIKELLEGLGVTLRWMFREPVTIEYPEDKRPVHERFRGRHILHRHDNGLERCIGCALCAAACPAQAIYVVPAENSDDVRHSPGERYAAVYEINLLRCIFCGFCEEACPVDAITLEHDYELSSYDRRSMVYTKEMLIEPVPAGGKDTPQTGFAPSPQEVLSPSFHRGRVETPPPGGDIRSWVEGDNDRASAVSHLNPR